MPGIFKITYFTNSLFILCAINYVYFLDARISSPVFTKPYTAMTQNRGQYPAGFPRFSQSNLSQVLFCFR